MDGFRWQRVVDICRALADRPAEDRSSVLDRECGGDLSLRAEIESLLAHDRGATEFLEPPSSLHAAALLSTSSKPGLTGRRIGAYTIRGVLGAGGMGIVYEAQQDNPSRVVALKVMRPLPCLDELTPRLFQREGQALARLEHPGIAAIHEAGRGEDGCYFFAMERVEGTPLTECARQRSLPIRERLELFRRVCEAVHYAHQRGVIHRDLKPNNILVTAAGQPKILDFGLARITDPDTEYTRLTEPGAFQGTLAYASPEQACGRADQIDVRSDVYSLGVILFELLTGHRPYEIAGLSLPEAARVVCERSPQRAGSLNRGLRGELETILGKALEKEPQRRYASAAALGEDIERHLNHQPILAHAPSTLYQLRKSVTRHKAVFGMAAGSMVLVCGLAVYAFWQAARAAQQRDQALAAQRRETVARASAEQVAAFLEKLFEQGDPEGQTSADPTVRDLLEAGVARLDSDLADQPLVYARLAHVLGAVYMTLADHPRARALIESALAIRQRELGDAHPDVADSLIRLAAILGRMGDPDRPHLLLLQALEIRRSHYGDPHEQVAAALEDVGCERFYARDNAAAVDWFRQSLDMRRALGTEDRPEIAVALHNLGSALQRLGRLDEAEQALLTALEMRRRVAGAEGYGIGLTLEALAHVYYDRGDFETAERYLAEQVDAFRRGLHPGHPKIAWGLRNYAFLVDQNRGPAQAEPIYREALAIQVAAFGEQHPEVANTLGSLAYNRMDQDDLEGAIALQQQALDIRRALLGENHDTVAHSLRILGEFYRRAGWFDEAEARLLESHAILTRTHSELSKDSVPTIQALITLYEQRDRRDLTAQWTETLARVQQEP